MRILLVTDIHALGKALEICLRADGFKTALFASASIGLDEALSSVYDAAVIDGALPEPGAAWLLHELRREDCPLHSLLLSPRGASASARAAMLDAGADCCLAQPFDSAELTAQLRALLRRRGETFVCAPAFGDLTLDMSTGLLTCGERSVRLDRTELELMRLLLLSGGALLSKETLLLRVWGYDTEAQASIVEPYISHLRKRLRELCSQVSIETAWLRGYRLTCA